MKKNVAPLIVRYCELTNALPGRAHQSTIVRSIAIDRAQECRGIACHKCSFSSISRLSLSFVPV